MKPILILGSGRTGKTTLARLLRSRLSTYNLLHADALRSAIMGQLPPEYPQQLLNYEQNSHYANLLLGLVHDQLRQDHGAQGLILDGGVISPQTLANHPFIKDNTPTIVYLGHGDLTAEDIFTLIRQNDTPNDWSYQLDDDALYAKTTYFARQNQTYRTECKLTGLHYIDTSKDRLTILSDLAKFIVDDISN